MPLSAAAMELTAPGEVLERANGLLHLIHIWTPSSKRLLEL
jgi:hypothetical protein